MTRGKWRKAWAVPVLAAVLAGAWVGPVLPANQTVSKTECRPTSGDVEQDKAALLLAAKRAAAAELYGEAINALTEVRDFSVTREAILSQVAGSIRVQGSPEYRNGDRLGEICVTVRAYATEADQAQYRPRRLEAQQRECVSGGDAGTLRSRAGRRARLALLHHYWGALQEKDEALVLALLRDVSYMEDRSEANGGAWCVRIAGSVYPFEVENLLAGIDPPDKTDAGITETDGGRSVPAESVSGSSPQEWSNSIGMEFVLIPAGEYRMGCVSGQRCQNNEFPVHPVRIAQGFYLGKYEVTQAQWRAVMADSPSYFGTGGEQNGFCERCPVEQVYWDDVQAFVEELNRLEGVHTYRLPTEAEWEYAARAGTQTAYSFGNAEQRLGQYAWYERNSTERTQLVGGKRPNAFGLYDMHGNVSEWVQDCWQENYRGAPGDGRAWESGDCSRRVLRGGSWYFFPRDLRSALRGWYSADDRFSYSGFRIARSLP